MKKLKNQLKRWKKQKVNREVKPEKAPKTETVKTNGKPASMEELLSSTGYTLSVPKPGAVLKGIVTDVTKKMILVDIGAKTEGIVLDREFDAARDYISDLKPGDEVNVFVISPENDRGQILLSLKRALVIENGNNLSSTWALEKRLKLRV